MEMTNQSPFLDVRSFAEEETTGRTEETYTRGHASPFLAVYEFEGEGRTDSQTEEYVSFLNELYDEQFSEALSSLVDEAATIYETNALNQQRDPRAAAYQAERLLNQHFSPLIAEAENMIRSVALELSKRDPDTLSEDEVEAIVDASRPSSEINPQFEEWLGGFLKKVVNKGIDLAKNAASAVAKLGLGPILNKLLGLVKPMIRRVIESAINRLPANLQPIARMLRDKLPFLGEFEEGEGADPETTSIYGI